MGALKGYNKSNKGDFTASTTAAQALAAPVNAPNLLHDLTVTNLDASVSVLFFLADDEADATANPNAYREVAAGTSVTVRNLPKQGSNVYIKTASGTNANLILSQTPSSDSQSG